MVQSNKKDFSGQNIAIGIDVHLRTWSVTVLTPSVHAHPLAEGFGQRAL